MVREQSGNFVERFLQDNKADRERIVRTLETYFERPSPLAALKHCLIGLAWKDENGVGWTGATERFKHFLEMFNISVQRNDKTLQRLALSAGKMQDGRIVPYAALWCAYELATNELLRQRTACRLALDLFDFIQPMERFLSTNDTFALEVSEQGKVEAGPAQLAQALRRLLQMTNEDIATIARSFFHVTGDGVNDLKDRSYYAVYRYSTEAREIVKTFLVITPPAMGSFDLFRFSHIYKARSVFRVARGVVVNFQKSIYFVGTSARKLRGEVMSPSEGMKIIALPLDELETEYRIVPGVYLSNALKWQPIVGRLALVHIGYQSDLGELTEAEVKPRVIKAEENLEEDIAATVKRKEATNVDIPPAEIVKFVTENIINTTFYDRGQAPAEIGFRALPIEDFRKPAA